MASYYRWRGPTGPATARFEPAARLISRQDTVTAFAFAFVTFSIVPFMGVLFCPAALLLGVFCMLRRLGQPLRLRSNRPMIALALAILVSTVQIGLWWMLVNVSRGGLG
jgi:hypothetical protein